MAIVRPVFPNHQLLLIISELLKCIPSEYWRLLDILSLKLLSSSQCRLYQYLSFLVNMYLSMTLSHCIVLLHFARIASHEIFEYVLDRHDRIFIWCVAAPGHYVLNFIALIHRKCNAIDYVLSWGISEMFCRILSIPWVYFILLVVDGLVCSDSVIVFCAFLSVVPV